MTEMVYGSNPVPVTEPVLPRWWRTIDKWTLSSIFMLFGIGLVLGLAASVPLASRNGLEPFYYVQKQAIFGGMGLATMIAVSMMSPETVRRLGTIGFLFAMILLVALPFVGKITARAPSAGCRLAASRLQPSEFLKPAFVVVTAWLMAASQQVGGPPGKILSFGLLVVVVGFLAMQPDFGQSALILFAWGVIYFVAGAPMFLIVGIGGLVAGGGVIAYGASEHFARRIDGFLAPDVDPRTQLGYATNAIQEGGFFGVGVGEGQVKWSLPDAHTDFIIAVAAEEYGLILVLLILALFGVIVVRSLVRLMAERDPFTRLAGAGLACVFGVQAMINMGVAVRLLPAKGMTLPFISYGGSSLIAAGITVGALLAMTRTRPRDRMSEVFKRSGR
ncbi:putative lipid II flippase FtsW [Rhodobacter sp.]